MLSIEGPGMKVKLYYRNGYRIWTKICVLIFSCQSLQLNINIMQLLLIWDVMNFHTANDLSKLKSAYEIVIKT